MPVRRTSPAADGAKDKTNEYPGAAGPYPPSRSVFREAPSRRRTPARQQGKWVVLYFYPKDDTPGCACQANEFTLLLTEFHDMNAEILGISPDAPASHRQFIQKYALKLTLLSDPDRQVTRQYGAWAWDAPGRAQERPRRALDLYHRPQGHHSPALAGGDPPGSRRTCPAGPGRVAGGPGRRRGSDPRQPGEGSPENDATPRRSMRLPRLPPRGLEPLSPG